MGEVEHLFGGETFGKVIFIEDVADDANALRQGGGALAEERVGHGGRRKMAEGLFLIYGLHNHNARVHIEGRLFSGIGTL